MGEGREAESLQGTAIRGVVHRPAESVSIGGSESLIRPAPSGVEVNRSRKARPAAGSIKRAVTTSVLSRRVLSREVMLDRTSMRDGMVPGVGMR
jgi:hypothetical protein